MPLFTPGRRWQPAKYAYKRESFGRRLLAAIERWTKGPMFGCMMCGNCLLQETAFICPMECPKGMRNGPCGGSTPERCYVDETRPCIWYKIYERAEHMGRLKMLDEVLPPMDYDKVGTETWWDVVESVKESGFRRSLGMFLKSETRAEIWDEIFRRVRQPEWWEGDSDYHAPTYDEPVSNLEAALSAGHFVVTSEVMPPMSTATGALRRNINMLKPYVTAMNFTDNASSTPRMSSVACARICIEEGAEPVLQIAARDRTRMGLQAEIIGASAMGIRNVICLTGDHPTVGPAPKGRMSMWDLDAVQMLWIIRRMRDEGHYLDGRSIKYKPKVFLGAAASPDASTPNYQALRERKKRNAGAQFFQTNCIFDTEKLDRWLDEIDKVGMLDDRAYILAGITPVKSLRVAEYMHNQVPGVRIPEAILSRFRAAGDDKDEQAKVGFDVTMELIEYVKGKAGINGIHLMAVGWEDVVPEIVEQAGLMPPEMPESEEGEG
jgi:methylenetetrahydrofolate reductase (NADPH)